MKLDDRDEAVLRRLDAGPATAAELAADFDAPAEALEDRLDGLADNGLVARSTDGRVERTDSGRRALRATGGGDVDDRVDSSDAAEAALAEFDLGPDEADAVRSAYATVRYWGDATRAELVDAVYAETPAGYDDPDDWWTALVREPLAALPDAVPPAAPGDPWRYAGEAGVDDGTADGRAVLDGDGDRDATGSVRAAVASLDLAADERAAVREAFAFLRRQGAAPERGVAESVFADHPAGYDDPDAWWDGFLRDALERLPNVDRRDGAWRYRRPPAGRGDDAE